MSEQEIIEEAETVGYEVIQVPGTDLVPVPQGNLFGTEDPVTIIEKATVLADTLSLVLKDRKLTSNISGKEHVRVEGWTLLGTMLGVFPVVEWTRPVADGWEARVEARTLAGQVVGAAEAECLRSEKSWKSRDDYALRSMAQTRAVSKALRGPLGFVVTLAGFEATPAEEVSENPSERPAAVTGPAPLKPPTSWAKLTEMMSVYDEATYTLFEGFTDSARRLLYPHSINIKGMTKADKDFMFQKLAGAALHVREKFDPNELPYPTADDLRWAFARVLDGQELALEGEA